MKSYKANTEDVLNTLTKDKPYNKSSMRAQYFRIELFFSLMSYTAFMRQPFNYVCAVQITPLR